MKAIFHFILFSICVINFSRAQNPLEKLWDYKYGGTDADGISIVCLTSNQQIVLAGTSLSGAGGEKTQANFGNWDYWIVSTDSSGNKLWDKAYGGSSVDVLTTIKETRDRGFILGGYSSSPISGNKTEICWGGDDYWIIKTDSLGNKLWDKDFGGVDVDRMYSIEQTMDGGYIIGGYSNSGATGNKSLPGWGLFDYWIIKTDSLGNKLWEKVYGGTGDDMLYSIQQTPDGGYILGGTSNSGVSGNKAIPGWGLIDNWILKLDSLGNKMWENDIGGFDVEHFTSILQTVDGGYLLCGFSQSGIGGYKSQPCWGWVDYWIIKTDSQGNPLWDRTYGGTDSDELIQVLKDPNGGYILSGDSYSPLSGNKTENNLGAEQTWILRIDTLGNILWDKTIFTAGHDEQGWVAMISGGCYTLANGSWSGVAGYKSTPPWSIYYDFWMVKFCDTTIVAPIAMVGAASNICPGTCIDFENQSAFASTYQWFFPGGLPDTSTIENPSNICYLNPGAYDVTLTVTNANGSDTLTLQNYITVFPHPPPQSITQSGDTLFALAGAFSYQWYFNSNSITAATNYFYVATQSGNYNVVATDSNGCEVEAVINNVIAANSQLAPDSYREGSWQLAIFPNPVIEILDIRGLELNSSYEISIFNVVGEKVFSAVDCKLPIGNCQLSSGMYYIEVNSNNKIFRSKFLKSTN